MPQNTSNNSKSRRSSQPIDNTYGHLQPQAVDIERVVLGALMIDKDAFSLVSDVLKPESFYEPRHQKIYQAVQSLSMEDKPVDLLTVTEELKRQGDIEVVGGVQYIMDLTHHVASSAHIEYHAHILAQKSLMRQLISYTSRVQELAFDDTADPDAVMQEAESSLFEIAQKNMKSDYTQIDPVLGEAVKILQKAAQNTSGLTGVPTGYDKLDDMTAGWQPSDLVIIAGRPAMGKTAFALSLAKNIAVDYQQPIAFFSLEIKDAKQRAPLPHWLTSVPSALKMRYLKSTSGRLGGSTMSSWSKPTPRWRSDKRRTSSVVRFIRCVTRSMTIKSLPRPCILVNSISIVIPYVLKLVNGCILAQNHLRMR